MKKQAEFFYLTIVASTSDQLDCPESDTRYCVCKNAQEWTCSFIKTRSTSTENTHPFYCYFCGQQIYNALTNVS